MIQRLKTAEEGKELLCDSAETEKRKPLRFVTWLVTVSLPHSTSESSSSVSSNSSISVTK
jgi:hypothetical protein